VGGWVGSLVVRTLDSQSDGDVFDCRPPRCRLSILALGKLFAPMCLPPNSIIWYWCKSREDNGRLWKRYGLPSIMLGASALSTQDYLGVVWSGCPAMLKRGLFTFTKLVSKQFI